jgi:hypothetical protein
MSDINWGLIRNGYTFQDLICALIRLEDHEARLYDRRGKDYAQDARSGDGRTIYQMKFHQNESTSSAIADAKAEAKKIATYQSTPGSAQEVWQGVQKWILVSNVAFNPQYRQKWLNEVEPLFAPLGLIADYWNKSVIEERLLKYPDLKQAYFGGETRVFLGIAEAREQVQSQGFYHPNALNAHYQGRELELEQYKNFLLNDSKKILVIHGAGGIGKTRFILEGAETQALPDGWQVLWANVATMMTTSSWFMGLIPELPTLLLIDEPDDATVLKTLVEQISGGRANTWKVAIAVRSPNDPVLKYVQGTQICQIVEELPLTSLAENAAVALCEELLELGSLQIQTADWKTQAATWISQHYDYYPIWMAIAVKLLESKGNLETIPQETDGLASEYLEEIITQQQNIPREQFLNLLRWTALFDTVNREDSVVIEWIRAKVGCGNSTEVQRYFDSLIARKVIFERGSHNRLLKIKPDVLADHILRNWLTYRRPSELNLRISDEAQEIVAEVSTTIDSAEASSIQKLLLMLLKRIARFELIHQLSKNPINLLGRLLSDWSERVPMMNAVQKLGYLSILDEISFAHVSEVLRILKTVLNSTSEPETVSTIFGKRIITHDDVILALPWIVYDTALFAQTDTEQMTILSLLCDLVIAERDIATHRPQGLPNDGKRAGTVLPRVITGGPEFRRNFGKSAFEKAKKLLTDICSQENISKNQKLHLDALVKPLLCIEQKHTLFDGRFIRTQSWFITPDQPEWEIRHLLRQAIKDILLSQKIQPARAVILWNLLAYAHREINQVLREFSQQQSVAPSYCEVFRTALIQDLQWVRDFLNSHRLDIQELTAARKIWDWHYKFDKNSELKEIATQCETFFEQSELFPQYAPLLRWESYEALGSWATEISDKLIASDNSQSIYDFVQNGVKFLGNPDQISRLFIVAENLGTKAQQYLAVRKFVEEALQLPIETPEFQFTRRLCQGWINTTRKDAPPETIAVIEQLLQWVNSNEKSEKIVQLIQGIYGTGLINITEPEVALALKQQEHFLQANSAVDFIGLLGGIFFYSSEEIKNIIEIILNKLEGNQLSSALDAFVQSLNYRMFPFTQNPEQTINPSLTNWILDQVLRLPNIDALDGITSEYLKEIFKVLGKPDLQWLVSAIETRIQMFSEADGSNIRILPSLERLSQWVTPISPEQADDIMIRNMIAKLLSYADSPPILWYRFPRYLVDVDPNGVITADLVVEKLRDPKIRGNPRQTWQWAKFAGYYPDDSPTWRKIAHEACSLAVQFDDSDKYSIFDALTNPDPKIWMSNIGEASRTFGKAVETAQQRLESETDPVLIPFRQWILQSAEAELSSEIERVKEEIGE